MQSSIIVDILVTQIYAKQRPDIHTVPLIIHVDLNL